PELLERGQRGDGDAWRRGDVHGRRGGSGRHWEEVDDGPIAAATAAAAGDGAVPERRTPLDEQPRDHGAVGAERRQGARPRAPRAKLEAQGRERGPWSRRGREVSH